MKKSELYVVTAYRWGYRSDHSYIIAVFTDIDKAKECADSHCLYRGGKYACVVEKCLVNNFDNELDDYTQEVYRAASSYE